MVLSACRQVCPTGYGPESGRLWEEKGKQDGANYMTRPGSGMSSCPPHFPDREEA